MEPELPVAGFFFPQPELTQFGPIPAPRDFWSRDRLKTWLSNTEFFV